MVVAHSSSGLRCLLLIGYCVLWVCLTLGEGFMGIPTFCGLAPCFSSNNTFNTCELGDEITVNNVTIFYRVSDAECTHFDGIPEDYNGIGGVYGYSNNVLWVDHGCRAFFRFCYTPGPSPMCAIMSCFSWNYAFKTCEQRAGIKIKKVTILSRLSDSECTFFDGLPEDYNGVAGVYGYNNNVLWVDHGCRAHFSFCYIEAGQPIISTASPSVTVTSTGLQRTSAKSRPSKGSSVWTPHAVTSVASSSSHTSGETITQSRSSEEPSLLPSSSPKTTSLSTSISTLSTITFTKPVLPTGNSKELPISDIPITALNISASPSTDSYYSAPSTTNFIEPSQSTIHSFITEVSTSASIMSKETTKLTTHTAITETRTSSATAKPTSSALTTRSTFRNSLFVSDMTSIYSQTSKVPISSYRTITPTTFRTTTAEGLLLPRNDTQTQNGNGSDSDDSATLILLTSVLAFLAVVVLVLVGTFLWRKRRAKRLQGRILQPHDDIL